MNLVQLLIILRRNALLVVLGPVVMGLAAFATTYLLPPVYETEAQLAIVKNGSIVNFDPRYRTISEIESAGIDQTARRKSLISLVKTFALASQVINKIDVQLDSTDREPANLLNEVTATIDGDLISIRVRSNDPKRAALIANTWTELYSVKANQLYGENALTTADLQAQLDNSKRDYDAKERALSDYLANNSIDLLTRQITQTQQHIADLVTLDNKMERLLTDATSLRSKVSADPASSGRADDLALLLLGTSAFSTWSDLPVSLQIPIDQLSAGSSLSDRQRGLETVIAILTERRIGIRAELNGSLHQEVNALKAQLEQAIARKRELTGARDISEAALTTLSNKLSEVRVTESSKTSVVKIASAAVAPTRPVGSRALTIGLATVLGFMLSLTVTLLYEYVKINVAASKANKPEPMGSGQPEAA